MTFLQELKDFGGNMGTVLAVIAIALVIATLLRTIARCYKKVSPNTVAVVTGRNHAVAGSETKRGYRYITGGGFLLIPILEKMEEMSLNTIPVKVTVTNVPDKNGALITVDAIANVKILSQDAMLPLAIERFLGKSTTDITSVIKDTLEGNLRGIVGTMEVQELLSDRQKFTQNVVGEAGADLGKMGLGVDVLKIQNIKDDRGYIESLGKKKTAEVVRDATIGEAEAKRETDQKSATARQAGQIATAQAEQAISDAQRERDIAIAANEAQVRARQAMIPIAAKVAEAERQKDLNVATVAAQTAQTEAEIGLEKVQADRNAERYNATIIVEANKRREARVIAADAEQQAAEREGEAKRLMMQKLGEGEQAKATAEAIGRMRSAEAVQAEMVAKAAGEQAELLARAEGTKAQALAEAEGVKAKLLAEAEGVLKKAEAFAKLNDAGKFLLILEAMPPVIKSVGDALKEVVGPAAEAIGEGLGNIKDLRIVDMGGKSNGSALQNFAGTPIEAMFGIWQKIEALGAADAARQLAKTLGYDVDALMQKLAESNAKTVDGVLVPTGAEPAAH